MSPRILLVGDPHCKPQVLDDCDRLWGLVENSVVTYKPNTILLLGDQHHSHDVLNSRVIDFWTDCINTIRGNCDVVQLVGNHDQLTPTIRHPHSLIPYKEISTVVDSPMFLKELDGCAMPYYHDPEEFVKDACQLHENHPDCKVLFCHQTFKGADKAIGFFDPNAIDQDLIPFKRIVSGHIHKPMQLGKVFYPGSPRWDNLGDAAVESRNIFLLEPGKPPFPITTNGHCTRIYRLEDSELVPLEDTNLVIEDLTLADIRVTVTGSADYVTKRITELKAKYNAKCQGKLVKSRLSKTSASEGISEAFGRFSSNYYPTNGTDIGKLIEIAAARLGPA